VKVPNVIAVGPPEVRGTDRGLAVAAAIALICVLIAGHGLRALAARRL
jgi:hypothetical protein